MNTVYSFKLQFLKLLRPLPATQIYSHSYMIAIGPSLRRKSFERVQPTLPRPSPIREPSSNGRTAYKQLKLPLQQLGELPKRHLFTMGNLSTDKSMSRIHSEQQAMKQSRYDYDHHNTDSIAQLFEHKNDSHVNSNKQKPSDSGPSSEGRQPASEPKMSVEEESIVTQREGEKEKEEEAQQEGREEENYDDYVMGDKVEEQPQEKPEKMTKKYALSHSTKTLATYQSSTESELRMQRQHILNQRRRLAQINEDKEIALLMVQYKNSKKQMLAHCAKKHEAARVIASLRQPYQQTENKIEKSLSLPALKPKRELIVPDDYYEEKPTEPWKNTKNLLAKNLEKREQQQDLKLKYTLSYGKLGFGRKKTRTICEQDILEEQMNSLEEIKAKLRAKGIAFDANKLKKGLLNQKHQPYGTSLQCPDKRLPSNPIYKKFPL